MNCPRHPQCSFYLILIKGRYKFCLECIAEEVSRFFKIPNIATPQEIRDSYLPEAPVDGKSNPNLKIYDNDEKGDKNLPNSAPDPELKDGKEEEDHG